MFQSTRPRGRTRRALYKLDLFTDSFNPRVLAGGRDQHVCKRDALDWFQSTRPRGRTRL